MKKLILSLSFIVLACFGNAYAFDLKSVLDKATPAVEGVVGGLLTNTDITVEQMAGTWTATGSAVSFQSENFLKKAGGDAAASTIEKQLNPYYEKLGLNNAVLTVQTDGSFTLKVKGISLSGTISKRSDGNFNFTFKAAGSINLGTVTAYVQKPVSGLDVMFDVSKLKSILTTIGGLTNNSLVNSATGLLNSYEGICVGFSFKGSGNTGSNSLLPSNNTNNNSNSNSNSSITNLLNGILKK